MVGKFSQDLKIVIWQLVLKLGAPSKISPERKPKDENKRLFSFLLRDNEAGIAQR